MAREFTWRRTLVANTVGGLIPPALFLWFDRSSTWQDVVQSTFVSMIYANAIGTTVTLAFVGVTPRISRLKPVAAWAAVVVLLVLCAVVGCAIGTALILALPFGLKGSYWAFFRYSLNFCIPTCLGIGIAVGVIEDFRSRLRTSALELRTRELQRERAEKIAAEARLSSLESRVHPHFLFNALNSISSLIREDPAQAERLVGQLAALLRFSLDAHNGLVPLEQEIKIVRDYLDIERARFGDRLRFSIEIDPALGGIEVPAMSVQTLVENAVKHSIAPRREGGSVSVRARGEAGRLRIEVSDDGPGFTLAALKQGHGLDLLQSRLASMFGDRASLDISGSTVAVSVPA